MKPRYKPKIADLKQIQSRFQSKYRLLTQKFASHPKLELTQPKPFSLMTDLRGAHYQADFKQKIEKESKKKKFIAQPIPISEPFQPERSKKALTEVQPFVSHISTRLEQRKLFDEQKEQQQKQIEQEEKEHAAKLAVPISKIGARKTGNQRTP